MAYAIQIPTQMTTHLRALRKAQGLSQEALGKRLGLSQTRIARIEGDPLSVSVEQLLQVLAALHVRMTFEPLASGSASLTSPSPTPHSSGSTGDW
jgi:HTH-type transcriptional regulator/antitoxin HipB